MIRIAVNKMNIGHTVFMASITGENLPIVKNDYFKGIQKSGDCIIMTGYKMLGFKSESEAIKAAEKYCNSNNVEYSL